MEPSSSTASRVFLPKLCAISSSIREIITLSDKNGFAYPVK
jgi:hypothetical protein